MNCDGEYDFYTSGVEVFKINTFSFCGPAITVAGNGANVGYIHLADGKFDAYQRTYVLYNLSADRYFLKTGIENSLPSKITNEVRGSGIPYIVLNMLTNLNVCAPDALEQNKIGKFLKNLDMVIALHQRN